MYKRTSRILNLKIVEQISRIDYRYMHTWESCFICPNFKEYHKSLRVQYLFGVKVHTLKSKIGVLYLGLPVYLKIIKTNYNISFLFFKYINSKKLTASYMVFHFVICPIGIAGHGDISSIRKASFFRTGDVTFVN